MIERPPRSPAAARWNDMKEKFMRARYPHISEMESLQHVQRGFFGRFFLVMVAALLLPGYLRTLHAQSAPPAGPAAISARTYAPREGSYNPVADRHAMVTLNHTQSPVGSPLTFTGEYLLDALQSNSRVQR